jgi:hypothetical protein
LGAVSWGRFHNLLDAAIIEADPVGAEHRAAAAARERFVRLGRGSEHGLKLIIARAAAGDAIWFKATVDRIADILATQGDTDTVEVRRSKAIGILAQPAQALQLLCQHQADDWDGPAEPCDDPEFESGATDAKPPVPNPPMLRLRIWPTTRPSNPPIQTRFRMRTATRYRLACESRSTSAIGPMSFPTPLR